MAHIIGAYIEVTSACNEKCPYCYNKSLMQSGNSLSIDILRKTLLELKANGIGGVSISGGEPFLYQHIKELLQYSKEIDTKLTIISNGCCFQKKNYPLLLEYQPNLQLTFDGHNRTLHDATRGEDNFSNLINGISRVRAEGYRGRITLRYNLHKKNIDHIQDFFAVIQNTFDVDSLENRDITDFAVALIHKSEFKHDPYDDYIEPKDLDDYQHLVAFFDSWNTVHTAQINYDIFNPDLGCAYNDTIENVKCGLRIALDGSVFPCQGFSDNRFCIGNIYDSAVSEIINGKKMLSFIDSLHIRKENIGECKSCSYTFVCSGGCPARAFIESGTINAVSDRCDLRKKYFNSSFLQILQSSQKVMGK